MGGVFINYRRGPRATDAVHRLHERLSRHFGATQVFLDTSSMPPGNRYPDDLRRGVHDCEVLLVTISEGWLEARDSAGERCLDRAGDWVRHEIELALAAEKTVIPLLLDAAEPPPPELLPLSIRELSLRQAHRVTSDDWDAAVEKLIVKLERLVAPEWTPIRSEERPPRRPGRLLGWATGLISAALCVLMPWAATAGGLSKEPGRDPVSLRLALASLGLMGVVLVAVLLSCGLMRRPVQAWERDLQDATQKNYLRATYPIPVFLLFFATLILSQVWGQSPSFAVVLMLGMCIAVGPMAAHIMRSLKKDRERWMSWPEAMPATAPVATVRREIARLDVRTQEWSAPIRREQRDRASFALGELQAAVATQGRTAKYGRLQWLREAQPWVFSGYVLWLALTVALTLAWTVPLGSGLEDGGGVRLHAAPVAAGIVGFALAWTTMECAYRYQRWQRRRFHAEAVRRLALVAARVDTLTSPSRTRLVTARKR
ncbi:MULTISPECIES: toll/interleukin-1 receptor domain-containing protein [unclassified Streptomyces]|uniref:toll/interleukin-1 receptor domain-containing protein n=1 Tax=unclassified Streptomyces TaxID=2593676 RepID=UPI00039BD00E|nr:toll/interleukin-1 receptor domain-containing protein [Streptomyces sp. BoleA5]MYX32674.1 TIR domain-containing protein [Streptomyces sp. SID8377]